MIPASFEYHRAASVDDAIEALGRDEDAKLLAGGHSLVPAMKLRIARPSVLVDLGRLAELRYVRDDGDRIAIGALTRQAQLVADPVLEDACAVVARTAELVGDPQVRHRGTIGGSVAHADPASDLPAVLLALDADFVARGPDGERTIPASSFFTGPFETALGPREVLVEIRVPRAERGVYLKHARRAQDWATVGVAAVVVDGATRVAFAGMGATPLRVLGVEEALANGAGAAEAASRSAEGTEPPSDVVASSEYRAHLARVYVQRALDLL
jgi:carbon-monoxide dehydrogenase medium subunit